MQKMEIEKPGNCTILKDKIVIVKNGPKRHELIRLEAKVEIT